MITRLVPLSLALVCSIAIFPAIGAEKVDTSKLPAPSEKKDVTFEKDIKPIFEQHCFKCHGPEKQKGKYRADSLEAVKKAGDSEEAPIVSGKSAESPLMHYIGYLIEDMEMPPLDKDGNSKQLPKDQIALIRAWIDQGAK